MEKRESDSERNFSKKNILVIVILSFIIFILGIYLFSSLIDYLAVLEKKEVYTEIIVGDHYGFDINGTSILFGMIPPDGGSSYKEIILKNKYEEVVNVKIFIKGNISDFIIVSKNNFNLNINEEKKIGFTASIPKNTELGIYNGKIHIVIKRAIIKD
ncbi:MAG: hypothetical protein Q8N99_05220 [Nanoarchaeota archaeon]|nr:hypothetical protein [Nanoarchaeota archaeon]